MKKVSAFSVIEFTIGLIATAIIIYAGLNITNVISQKKADSLIVSMSNLQKSIATFKTINDAMPGDLFSGGVSTSGSSGAVQNIGCGNGDGMIAYHTFCGNANGFETNGRSGKCNVAQYNSSTKDYILFNEVLLFAKHLSDFGVIERRLADVKENFYNTQFSSQNTIQAGYDNLIFIPMLFDSANSLSAPSFAIPRSDKLHTIVITSLDSFLDYSTSFDIYNTTQVTTTKNSGNNTYLINTGGACTSIPLFPSSFSINYSTADYIDKKIDDGVRTTGKVKHCSGLSSCEDGGAKGKVIIGFLEKF